MNLNTLSLPRTNILSLSRTLPISPTTQAVGVECAKRSGILAVDDNFYSFRSQHLALQLHACGAALFGSLATPTGRARLLGERWSDVQLAKVSVYGELFGGAYPHPEVAAVPGLQAVQKGIW